MPNVRGVFSAAATPFNTDRMRMLGTVVTAGVARRYEQEGRANVRPPFVRLTDEQRSRFDTEQPA